VPIGRIPDFISVCAKNDIPNGRPAISAAGQESVCNGSPPELMIRHTIQQEIRFAPKNAVLCVNMSLDGRRPVSLIDRCAEFRELSGANVGISRGNIVFVVSLLIGMKPALRVSSGRRSTICDE